LHCEGFAGKLVAMQRLGKNLGGYFGEIMDLLAVLKDLQALGETHGWQRELIYKTGNLEVFALHKPVAQPARRIYISAGIHGDEPAGPLAALQLLRENEWPAGFEIWLCPCLNPTGFFLNTRENEDRKDLNRDYRDTETGEVAAHIRWLERQPNFDAAFCLHEDWESHGFYLYEVNPDGQPALAEKMVAAVTAVCPIDMSPVIEGREAKGGIINPSLNPAERPKWPEAFWLLQNKTRLVYTLEAPSDFPLAGRVAAIVAAMQMALAELGDESK
jgi:predicted deacylase